jgi:hypothetical protein
MSFNLNEWIARAQIKIWFILGAIIAVGAAGSLGYECIPWPWLSHIAQALCPPLFTAGILGLTVDTFLKQEIARDVFVAAFRYVLPDELKEEVRRIIGYKFLCTESMSIVTITALPNNLVRVHISHERVLRNITGHSEPFFATFALDEWGFADRSTIEECYLLFDSTTKNATNNPAYDGKTDAIGQKSEEVAVKPGAIVRTVAKGFEIHRSNGELHMEFRYPSINPIVRVETSSGISHSCTFGIPDEKVIRSNITKQYRLEGTQFPGQRTRVRWWPEKQMATAC